MTSTRSMSFQYSPLGPGDLRLLYVLPESTPSDIRCTLSSVGPVPDGSTADVEHSGSGYIALSYEWRGPKPVAIVTVNGKSFGVAQNLHDCLQCLIENTYKDIDIRNGLWIDAMCINQQDDVEKTKQVQQMWRIYTNAAVVLSWLGLGTPTTASAMAILQNVEARNETCSGNTKYHIWNAVGGIKDSDYLSKIIRPTNDNLRALTSNDYFSRRWILQELACATDIILLGGNRSVSFDIVKLVFEIEVADVRYHRTGSTCPISYEMNNMLYIVRKFGRAPKALTGGNASFFSAFEGLLGYCDYTMCSDPRDAVLALLSLPGVRIWNQDPRIWQRIVPDYTMTVEMIFVAVVVYYNNLLARDFSIECGEKGSLRYNDPRDSEEAAVVFWLEDVQRFLDRLSSLLRVDYRTDEFFAWLQRSVFYYGSGGVDAIQSKSGTLINCSGFILVRNAERITERSTRPSA